MADKKKSNTVYLELPAVFEWAKVFTENMDKTGPNDAYVSHGGAYTVDAIMTKDVFQQLKDAGSQAAPSVFHEGKWYSKKMIDKIIEAAEMQGEEAPMPTYAKLFSKAEKVKVKFKRKHDAPYTYGGPPQVAHADGTPWDINDDGLIGNESSGIIYASVYEAGGLKGTRLDGLQVMNHVQYDSGYDPDEDGEYQPRGFRIPNRTGQTGKPKAKEPSGKAANKPAKKPAMIEDEIPF